MLLFIAVSAFVSETDPEISRSCPTSRCSGRLGFGRLRLPLPPAAERRYVGQTELVYWDMGERLAAPPRFAAVARPDAIRLLSR